jgi:lysozyme family protein
MNYDEAFKIVIGHEGGYVNDLKDPGGETKYGISKRAYPTEDIKSLTLDRAKAIYKRDYWDKVRADELPKQVRFSMFDAAVNSGVVQSIKWLQRAVGTTDDGIIGPQTLAQLRAREPNRVAAIFNGQRLKFMASLPTFDRFGKGWARRIAENLINLP